MDPPFRSEFEELPYEGIRPILKEEESNYTSSSALTGLANGVAILKQQP